MGYQITLVQSHAGPIPWDHHAQAVRTPGWQVDDRHRELWPRSGDRVVARLIQTDSGAPWTSSPDKEALTAVIAPGGRARGDGFAGCRTADDRYVHPDDRAVRVAVASASAASRARRARRKQVWDGFRIVVLAGLAAIFAARIWADVR